ncbi:MAG TPA: Uma2 family endonuclease [Elainellaceae cyanobacterium]
MSSVSTKQFTLDEYHRLVELGFFHEDDRIELIHGDIIQMAAKGTAHEVCLTKLNRELVKLIDDQATLRCQSPIILPPDSEPEPDFSIVRDRSDDYLSQYPGASDVFVVIEIADSSLEYDQTVKLKLYAKHGIQHYWIFNLLEHVLEIYHDSYQSPQGDYGYRVKRTILPDEAIALPQMQDKVLHLSKVFP